MPGRFELKPTLVKIWHAPDNLRIMDPLPTMHRRGIIIAALAVVIGFLLPSNDDTTSDPVSRTAQLDVQSQSRPQPDNAPMQTQLVTPSNDPGLVAPVEPEPVPEEQPQEQEQPQAQSQPQTQPFQENQGIDQQWRSYRVEPGKTLAQLFRDHNLPATDVYAMAQVEGAGKPLSNLQNGQMVQIRQNASGVVTGLTIDTGNGQVLFTRQPNGSFIRAR
jgi:Cell envelope opacity-associated protein A